MPSAACSMLHFKVDVKPLALLECDDKSIAWIRPPPSLRVAYWVVEQAKPILSGIQVQIKHVRVLFSRTEHQLSNGRRRTSVRWIVAPYPLPVLATLYHQIEGDFTKAIGAKACTPGGIAVIPHNDRNADLARGNIPNE